jgi:hypothetical protein
VVGGVVVPEVPARGSVTLAPEAERAGGWSSGGRSRTRPSWRYVGDHRSRRRTPGSCDRSGPVVAAESNTARSVSAAAGRRPPRERVVRTPTSWSDSTRSRVPEPAAGGSATPGAPASTDAETPASPGVARADGSSPVPRSGAGSPRERRAVRSRVPGGCRPSGLPPAGSVSRGVPAASSTVPDRRRSSSVVWRSSESRVGPGSACSSTPPRLVGESDCVPTPRASAVSGERRSRLPGSPAGGDGPAPPGVRGVPPPVGAPVVVD